jgi:hypothetical protein
MDVDPLARPRLVVGVTRRARGELLSFDKDCVRGPPESEPGTSTSPHASLEFLTKGGGTLRAWGILGPTSSDGRDVALFVRLVVTNAGGKAELEGKSGRLRR